MSRLDAEVVFEDLRRYEDGGRREAIRRFIMGDRPRDPDKYERLDWMRFRALSMA